MWVVGIRLYGVKLPWIPIGKITLVSILAALSAHFVAAQLRPLWAVLCGGTAALVVLFGLIYLLRVLEPEDHSRFRILTGMLPKSIAGPADKILSLLIRTEFADAAPTSV
jgi:hypothetical protein